jgi:hypothetical protein
LQNEKLHNFTLCQILLNLIKSRNMRWAGHVARVNSIRNVHNILDDLGVNGASRGSSVSFVSRYWTNRVRSPAGAEDLSFSLFIQTPVLGPIQPPIQWVPGVKRSQGVLLTTHSHLVLRSRIRSYTSPPQSTP